MVVETSAFTSELTVTNLSEETRRVYFDVVADAIETEDHTATFYQELSPGRQFITPNIIDDARRVGVEGLGSGGGIVGPLFARAARRRDLSGIAIGARTGSSGGGGWYSVFYNAVPEGAGFSDTAWVDGLQQNAENRSNLALVNTGKVDDTSSTFRLDIYDGETGTLAKTVHGIRVAAKAWLQIGGILQQHARGTAQGYVRIRKTLGNNPFLAYGVINDGGAPGQRSGDGAYLPARK